MLSMIIIIIKLKGENFVMKYLLKGKILLLLLILLTIILLFIGVSELSIKDIFHLSDSQQNILFSSRIRTMSILIAGSSLALAGLIMQQMMQNKFVESNYSWDDGVGKIRYLNCLIILSNWSYFIKTSICCYLQHQRNIFIC